MLEIKNINKTQNIPQNLKWEEMRYSDELLEEKGKGKERKKNMHTQNS